MKLKLRYKMSRVARKVQTNAILCINDERVSLHFVTHNRKIWNVRYTPSRFQSNYNFSFTINILIYALKCSTTYTIDVRDFINQKKNNKNDECHCFIAYILWISGHIKNRIFSSIEKTISLNHKTTLDDEIQIDIFGNFYFNKN